VPAERAPSMIDEYPILAVAASFAEGRTRCAARRVARQGKRPALRHRAGLKCAACTVEELPTADHRRLRRRRCAGRRACRHAYGSSHRDVVPRRGTGAREAISVDDVSMIATSFPEFEPLMRGLGADFKGAESMTKRRHRRRRHGRVRQRHAGQEARAPFRFRASRFRIALSPDRAWCDPSGRRPGNEADAVAAATASIRLARHPASGRRAIAEAASVVAAIPAVRAAARIPAQASRATLRAAPKVR
jgi:hypothetical protein